MIENSPSSDEKIEQLIDFAIESSLIFQAVSLDSS